MLRNGFSLFVCKLFNLLNAVQKIHIKGKLSVSFINKTHLTFSKLKYFVDILIIDKRFFDKEH